MDIEYYASERFIHDGLIEEAERGLPSIPEMWKKDGRVSTFIIVWPSDEVYADDGSSVAGPIVYDLSDEPKKRRAELQEIISTVQPYGLLFVEQLKDRVQTIFETMHGAKAWIFKIKDWGGTKILDEPRVEIDGTHLGLLWRQEKARG